MLYDIVTAPFFIIFIATPVAWLYFVIRKQHFNTLIKKNWSRKKINYVFLSLFVFSYLVINALEQPQEPLTSVLGEEIAQSNQLENNNASQSGQLNKETALVTRVIDGDTFEIEGGRKVRYIGIDTPESKDPNKPIECFSKEATEKNKALIEHKEVTLEKDVNETDRYGRLLRYVYLNGVMINEILVKEGFAQASAYPPDIKYQALFELAQKEARNQNSGLWGDVCSS